MEVLILERFSSEALGYLKSHNFINITEDLSKAEVLVIRSKTKIDFNFLENYPNLKYLVTATSGFDHIDLQVTTDRRVRVFNTPEANTQSAAELTWALILATHRKLLTADKAVRNINWDRNPLVGTELDGKTLGIVGLGRIGSRVAQIGRAFGMQIVAFDPYVEQTRFQELGATRMGFTEVVRMCDVLTLHVPYTKETHHMINARSLEEFSRDAVLINTCRGSVVLEQEISNMLQTGKIRAAGFDVFMKEPLPKDSPLLGLNNVVLTPHIGASTEEAFQKASRQAAQTIIDLFHGNFSKNELFPHSSFSFRKSE